MKLHHPVILSAIALCVFAIFGFLTYNELHAPEVVDEDVEEIITNPEPEQDEDEQTDLVVVPADIQAHIDSKSEFIVLSTPTPYTRIESPLTITGMARGYWFFEASFPIYLTNWDGLIIAEGYATADGEWMTEEFVPFTASLTFTEPNFDERGTLILKRDNPSGLPEHDNALEIPVRFSN